MRDLPTAIWLLLTLVAVIAHQQIPAPRWLIIHLLLLGAITHAILVWSQYFSFALLRSRASLEDRRRQNLRLIVANAGTALVLIGVPSRLWPLTLAGAAAVIVAVAWHGASLAVRARASLPGRFGRTIRYYVASAGALTVGAAVGAILALGGRSAELSFAHVLLNVLGWVGLTVAGTVVTLWPTILRTRADEHAATGAARALPLLAAGVLVAAAGAGFGLVPVLALGLAAYLAGLAIIGLSLWRAARRARLRSFAALSIGAALSWWAACVTVLLIGSAVATWQAADSWHAADLRTVIVLLRELVPYLGAGFAVQVLIGALSYLVPVVLGGGPRPVKAGSAVFDRFGRLRAGAANLALALTALPVAASLPQLRQAAIAVYVVSVASFLVIMMVAMRAQRRAKAVADGA